MVVPDLSMGSATVGVGKHLALIYKQKGPVLFKRADCFPFSSFFVKSVM